MLHHDDQLEPDDDPLFTELVHTTLERDLLHRHGLDPHAQLGVSRGADADTIERAWRELRARYDAESFELYGVATVAVALRIRALLDAARAALLGPSLPRERPESGLFPRMLAAWRHHGRRSPR
jgi:hypothetical protein